MSCFDAPARTGLRRLLALYWLAGAVPMAIVAAVVLASLWRSAAAQPELERSLAALAGLLVLIVVAAGLFAWLIGRKLAARVDAAGSAARPPSSLAAPEPSREHAELRRALEAEGRARRAVEEANQRTHQLLAMLAHELSNPLGAISNAARVLDRLPPGSADYQAAREVIGRQTEHLAKTVHDLLGTESARAGGRRLQRNLLDLAQCVAAAAAALKATCARQWTLELASVLVSADPARLDQVLAHVLGEAVQRTAPGDSIRLILREEGGEAILRVEDGGGEPPATPTHGFLLAQRLVELHGGRLQAGVPATAEHGGFTLRLPALPEPQPAAQRSARVPPAPRPTRQARVLIVEDNEDARITLQRILQAEGHLVSAARDAQAGLEAALAGSPNVAVVDIGLPGMDGCAFARTMRERLGSGVRLIALTGYGSESDRRRTAEAGFDAHLAKPVDIDRLLAIIAES